MALYAFDGTWNKDEPVPEKDTNVVRFVEAYKKGGAKYLAGVGTRFSIFGKIVGGITGAGGRSRILRMYKHACRNYAAGDTDIDVVGFSRGAALAVHFCNVLAKKGLELPDGSVACPKVRFLGLWDIVASFGIPVNIIIPFNEINVGWDLELPENVGRCYHAMAQDEVRQTFRVTRLDPGHTHPNVEELWFRGVHSDVGGGNGATQLSNITLHWMLQKAAECGVPVDPDEILALEKPGRMDPTAPLFENFDPIKNTPREILPGDKRHITAYGEELKPGDIHTFPVHASELYSWTGVWLKRGGQYLFHFEPGQVWIDKSIRCGPEGWTVEKEKMPLFIKGIVKASEGFRRHPDADWFEVIGAFGKSEDSLFRIGDGSKSRTPYVASQDGPLYAFANDLESRYDNNKGKVEITVTRIA